jgi:hypothetical protein
MYALLSALGLFLSFLMGMPARIKAVTEVK